MDEISIIAVGIDAEYISTTPLIDSMRAHDADCQIVIVDNAADVPYQDKRAEIVRLDKRVSMAEAMNEGAKVATGRILVFMNNDVLCLAPFAETLKALSKKAIHGKDPIDWWGRHWLDGWIMVIPRTVWKKVGEFDPAFTFAGFEDADYCFRAEEKGYAVNVTDLPFEHKELHSRFSMPNYMAQRERNIEYLCKKWGITR